VDGAGNFSSFLLLEETGFTDDVAPLVGPGAPPGGTTGGDTTGGGTTGGGTTNGGTNGGGPVIPLPVAAWPALGLLGALGIVKKLRRSRH
jgi:hypothetical protein